MPPTQDWPASRYWNGSVRPGSRQMYESTPFSCMSLIVLPFSGPGFHN